MKSFAFRQSFFVWLSLLAILFAVTVVKSCVVSTKEEKKLHELIESSPKELRKLQMKTERELTKQTRWGVCKQFYIATGQLRRQIQLSGSRSDLVVMSKKPHMHVKETFYDARGLVQQELFYKRADGTEVRAEEVATTPEWDLSPMQRFRYFEAQNAVYDFQTHQLRAYGVKFWTFTTMGHELVTEPHSLTPEISGQASKMTFYVQTEDSNKNFSAENIHVHFARVSDL